MNLALFAFMGHLQKGNGMSLLMHPNGIIIFVIENDLVENDFFSLGFVGVGGERKTSWRSGGNRVGGKAGLMSNSLFSNCLDYHYYRAKYQETHRNRRT